MLRSNPVRMLSIATVALAVLLRPSPIFASDDEEPDEEEGRNPSVALTELFFSNFVVWAYDYYVLQAGYAQISPETWNTNLRNGFQWDRSTFFTNQILHPYQGNLYFNSARTNGFTFWESVPFAIAGSLTWEFFGEREKPSINDLITTSFGGIALGEGGYRLSSLLIFDDTPGYKGFLKKTLATVLNPVMAVNRIVYGDKASPPPKMRGAHYALSIVSGMSRTRDEYWIFGSSPHPFLGVKLRYGDPYDESEEYEPYDYFTFQGFVDVDASNPTWDIFGHAMLYGRKLFLGEDDRGVVGFYQHFDYLENFVYKFASNGAGVGVQLHYPFPEKRAVEFLFHLFGIALGGVNSQYSRNVDGREYSLGSGAGIKTGLFLEDESIGTLSLLYSRYWFSTLSGSDDQNVVGIFTASVEHYLKNDLRIGLEALVYDRWSNAVVDNSSSFGLRTYLIYDLER